VPTRSQILARLTALIAAHETFFATLGQRNPRSIELRNFLRRTWDPFFAQWSDLVIRHHVGASDVDVLRDVARELSIVRRLARARGIPVPALDVPGASVRSAGFFSDVWNGIADAGTEIEYTLGDVWDTVTQGEITMAGHHGGHGGHGHGHHGGGRRRPSGGAWWGPSYPYGWDGWYDDDAPEIVIQNPAHVTLLGHHGKGRHLGKSRELALVGQILTPGANGFSMESQLGADRVLHVKICIDDQCYEGSADLSKVLAALAAKIAAYHDRLHASSEARAASDAAVRDARSVIVGALLGCHRQTLTAGWFDSLKGAVLTVHHAVASTVQKFKGPITAAATVVATYYGGPLGGMAAAKLTPMVVDGMAKIGDKKHPASKKLAQVTEAAKHDPKLAQALATAKEAALHTAAAYHVSAVAADAAGGDPAAQKKIDAVKKDAAAGDKSAQGVMDMISDVFTTAAKSRMYKGTARDPNWQVDESQIEIDNPKTTGTPSSDMSSMVEGERLLVGAAAASLRDQASAAAAQMPGRIVGVALTGEGWHLEAFDSVDDADDWFGNATDVPHLFVYAAYFDKGDPLFPAPLNEAHGTLGAQPVAKGRAETIRRGAAIASGIPVPLLAALGAGAGYVGIKGFRNWLRHHDNDLVANTQANMHAITRARSAAPVAVKGARGGTDAASAAARAAMRTWAAEMVWNEISASKGSPAAFWLVTNSRGVWSVLGADTWESIQANIDNVPPDAYYAAFEMGASAPRMLYDRFPDLIRVGGVLPWLIGIPAAIAAWWGFNFLRTGGAG